VRFSNPHNGLFVDAYALIDTGADECALPAPFASVLGHHLENGQIKHVGTGNGVTTAYAHTTSIAFQDFTTGDVDIDYMPNLRVPLLGVRSFLSRFVLTVDYPRQVFSLSK
jgi:predicted aspartyl protease